MAAMDLDQFGKSIADNSFASSSSRFETDAVRAYCQLEFWSCARVQLREHYMFRSAMVDTPDRCQTCGAEVNKDTGCL